MRKKYLLLFFMASLFSVAGFTQSNPAIDSLLGVLKNQSNDTNKVNSLNALSKLYIQAKNISNARKYAGEALSLAEKKGFTRGITDAHINTAYAFNAQGNIYLGISNPPEALKNYLAALTIFENNKSKNGAALVSVNMGSLYLSQRNYPAALKNYSAALKLYEETGNKNGVAAQNNNIGLVYENQGNFQTALTYYNTAIRLYEETGNKWALIDRYFNIGFLYEDQANYPEALKNHLAALKISQEIGTKEGMAASNANIGGVYFNQDNYPAALESYMLALKIYQEIEDQEGVAIISTNIGSVYLDLKDYKNAKQYLSDGLSLSRQLELIENIKTSYEAITRLDSATGNWQEALINHKLFIVYRDSLASEVITQKMTKTQLQYDFGKKEDSLKYQQALTNAQLLQQILLSRQQQQALLLNKKEYILLSNQKQLQQLQMQKDSTESAGHKAEVEKKQGLLVLMNKEKMIQTLELNKQKQLKKYLLAGLVLFFILSFFIYRNYRSRQQLKLQMLRNKIARDLHDEVGSTLSSISIFSEMAKQQTKEVIPMLDTIGESSRKMLDAMADIVWTINPENDQFEKIILRMRSFAFELLGARKIDFQFIAHDDVAKMKLPMEVRKNLYLIFKEATNNLVKYAGADKAMFAIKGENNHLIMLIQDNGKGFDTTRSTQGNGLKNMQKRAEEINARLTIASAPGTGTTIQLSVAV
jgi:signal transduction histidine kinase